MPTSHGLIAVFLNFFGAGTGYAYCGRTIRAGLALTFSLFLLIIFSFLAAFSSWFLVVGSLCALVFFSVVAFDSFRCSISTKVRPCYLYTLTYVLAFAVCYHYLYLPVRRVVFLTTTEINMEPTLQRGDHLALDREFSDFKTGDLVVAEMEDQSLVIRRILELKSATAILVTDSKVHSRSEEVPLNTLHGKILYVLYSADPETSSLKWNRFLMKLN